jgi:hypothetical protein
MKAIKFQSFNFKIPYARKAINMVLCSSDHSRRILRKICRLSLPRLFETHVQNVDEQELEIAVTACTSNLSCVFI